MDFFWSMEMMVTQISRTIRVMTMMRDKQSRAAFCHC